MGVAAPRSMRPMVSSAWHCHRGKERTSPCMILGGRFPQSGVPMACPRAAADRSAIDSRPDVLTFTSEPALEPMEIAGDVVVGALVLGRCADLRCELCFVAGGPAWRDIAVGSGLSTGEIGNGPQSSDRNFAPCHVRDNQAGRAPAVVDRRRVLSGLSGQSRHRKNPTAASAAEARIITLGVRHGGQYASRLRSAQQVERCRRS